MTGERKGILAVVLAAVGYGFLSVLLKLALAAGVGVFALAAWRFILGTGFVVVFLVLRRRPLPSPRTWAPLAGLGCLYAVNALAFIAALQWIPATTATLVFYAYPTVVVALAALFLDERLTRRKAVGVALATAGVTLTAGLGAAGGHPLGIGLVLLSMLSLSVYIVAGRGLLAQLPAQGSAAIIMAATTLVLVGCAGLAGTWSLDGGGRAFGLVVLVSLVSTAIPITLFVVGLKRIGAGRAAIYSTLEPVVTVIAAAVLLGESIAPLQYIGGGLVLAGVVWLRLERPPPSGEASPLETP